jgi:ubiquitin carboxyl-terminal hydrolase 4/11/15
MMHQQQQQQKSVASMENGDVSPPSSPTRVAVVTPTSGRGLASADEGSLILRPYPDEQKKDVIRLLVAHSQVASTAGEAFFLISWSWWCDWCRYVDFFLNPATTNNGSKNTSSKLNARLLSLLPAGAVLPDISHDGKSVDESSDDDEEVEEEDAGPPGPIDNSGLFLPAATAKPKKDSPSQEVFYYQWYRSYYHGGEGRRDRRPEENMVAEEEKKEQDEDRVSLRPNLVRGHHYELLPREVYAALLSWYGEVTPSVCRRSVTRNNKKKIVLQVELYPALLRAFERMSIDGGVEEEKSCADEEPRPSGPCSACRAPTATCRCKQCLRVHYCDRLCQENHWPFHRGECKKFRADTSPADREIVPQRTSGRVGLNNLGNTCFMNAALQCLSHATPLTRYFLSGRFRGDLNQSNPLGTGGKLAHSYDIVMKDLWMRQDSSSTSPTSLKRAIALFAPRFAGCLQHDAQEFLAYLLDGLHEDLNRIKETPYVEMPDVTDSHNMAVAGAHAWDAHRRRNDSLVMDTFYGQFKSTCVCPKCDRVSVSFDAFNHVSLEIPQEKNASIPISIFVFLQGNRKPVRCAVSIHRQDRVGDFKQALSNLCGILAERFSICEVYQYQIIKLYHDPELVADIHPTDTLVAYELDPPKDNFHAIASHRLMIEPRFSNQEPERFGFPLMTSFPGHYTCKQVWDHMWSRIGHLVASPSSSENDDKELLQIHVTDHIGRPIHIFPVEEKGSNSPSQYASVLPSQSDKKLASFLGENAIDSFLFLSLEWTDPTDLESDDEDGEAKIEPRVDEARFLESENHPSWTEAAKKLKAMRGTKGVTLDECFEQFTKPERLDEHNMWFCSRCKEHVRAMKTMQLWRLPNILLVHLKRFEFKHALRRDKLDTLVDFPLDGLDMSVHCASARSTNFVDGSVPALYDCFAVVNHFGRMGFGHYTAFARQWDEAGIARDWALFDDSSVRSVGDGRGQGVDSVVSSAAYVLFYRRRIFH